MKIYVTSVLVDDQSKALAFYRDILGFQVKHDIDMGGGAQQDTVHYVDVPRWSERSATPAAPRSWPPLSSASRAKARCRRNRRSG